MGPFVRRAAAALAIVALALTGWVVGVQTAEPASRLEESIRAPSAPERWLRSPSSVVAVPERPNPPELRPAGDVWAEVARVNAIREALDGAGLAALLEQRLDDDPRIVSATIPAVGALGSAVAPSDRRRAVARLSAWLAQSGRDRRLQGFRSALIDALADSGDPSAVPPLARIVESDDVPLHLRARATEALAALAGAGSDAEGYRAVTHFAAWLEHASPGDDDFEQQLYGEARAIAAAAKARLGGSAGAP